MNPPRIHFIKKILSDGSACRKCAEVEQRLHDNDYMRFITSTVIADERDDNSQGMQLARQYAVERAPFFIVEHDDEEARVYTIYFKLVKEVIQPLLQAN